MRSHQFGERLDVTRFSLGAIIVRMRYYLRSRFSHSANMKKGQALRARNARRLTGKPWKR